MKILFNRYSIFEDGRIIVNKTGRVLKTDKGVTLYDGSIRKNFAFLRLYFEVFSGQKLTKSQMVRLKDDQPLSWENIEIIGKGGRPFRRLDPEKALSMYKDGGKLREIAYYFNINTPVIVDILKKNGINPSPKNCFRVPYKVNHDYFSSVNSYDKAYLLGVMFADGCVGSKSNLINLISNDYDLLDFFKRELEFTGDIAQNPLHKTAKHVNIASIQMKKDLIKLGCVPSKSLVLEFPDIEEKYFWAFLLGYFDGDGSLWVSKNKRAAHFKIMSSTKFCLKLQKMLKEKGFKSEVRTEPKTYKKETSYVRISSKKTIREIFSLLYKNANFFLRRKYDKFLEIA